MSAPRTVESIPLEAAHRASPREVGSKARNLGLLRAEGLPVPPGRVVPAAAWRAFVAAAGVGPDPAPEALARAALPEELDACLRQAAEDLGYPLAVRSAALEEDRAEASAAGVFRTVLGVEDRAELSVAVRACWASSFEPAARAYRTAHGGPAADGAVSVLLQRLLRPRAAGVAFTRMEGCGELLVEAVPGSGALLVDGGVNPVRLRLPREGPLDGELLAGAPLPPEALAELRALALRAEALLGAGARGVDVEWAWDDAGLHLLQARPITRPVRPEAVRTRWVAANTQEALLEPVTPLTWSLLEPLVEAGRRDLFAAAGLEEIEGPGYMRLFHGLPYFNPDYFRRFLRQIPGLPEDVFDALIFGEAGGRGAALELPEPSARALRLGLLALGARLGARERFEAFQRLFDLRLELLRRRRLDRLDDGALLALRRRATDLLEGALRRHVVGTAISGGAYLLLERLLAASGAEATLGGGLAARLTAGASGNALAHASAELWRLGERLARDPAGEAALERLALGEGPHAAAFRRFLARHGHRCEKEAELAEPRWADDPEVLLSVLRSTARAVRSGEGVPPLAHQEERARAAEALARRVSTHLARLGAVERWLPWRRAAFRALLREARRYAPYRENLKDRALRALHLLRRVFLEAGTRLVRRGLLDAPADVFYLELEEVEEALAGPASSPRASRDDLRERVRARRARRELQRARPAPTCIIEVPGRPPYEVHGRTPGERAVLEGVGVACGRVRGVARVLRSTEEAARLAPGEVLVARVVNAGWTPLFHLAGAVVAEVGGVLSHGAIVARELGVPAVFGAAGASRIPEGATVLVDGDLGLVSVEAPPPGSGTGARGGEEATASPQGTG